MTGGMVQTLELLSRKHKLSIPNTNTHTHTLTKTKEPFKLLMSSLLKQAIGQTKW
jgi:hypothetical protein